MTHLDALLVDLDGTLFDSLPALRLAYERFLSARGAAGSEAEFASWNGPPLAEVVAGLARTHGLQGDDLLAEYEIEVERAYLESAQLAVGARELLDWAHRRFAVAIVTSAPRRLAEALLATHELAVHLVIGAADTERGKPHPDPYLAAMAGLPVRPERCIAIEDSPTGVRAAVAAGVRCVAVGPRAAECIRVGALAGVGDLVEARAIVESLDVGPGRVVAAARFSFHTTTTEIATTPDEEARVTQLWAAARKDQPSRTDGEILSIQRWRHVGDEIELVIERARYRHYWAQRHGVPLGLTALGVSGLTRLPSGALAIGRRAPHMTQYPGCWEAIPSGGVAAARIIPNGGVDVEGQLLEELSEELGVATALRVTPLGLVEDLADHVVDLGYIIDIDATEAELRAGDEYDAVEVIAPDALHALCANHERPMVPVTGALLALLLRR